MTEIAAQPLTASALAAEIKSATITFTKENKEYVHDPAVTLPQILQTWSTDVGVKLINSVIAMRLHKLTLYRAEKQKVEETLKLTLPRIQEFRKELQDRYELKGSEEPNLHAAELFNEIKDRFPEDLKNLESTARIDDFLNPLEKFAKLSTAKKRDEVWANLLELKATLEAAQQNFVGRQAVLNFIAELIVTFANNWEVFKRAYLVFALLGNPGTGKSEISQLIGKVFSLVGILLTAKFSSAGRGQLVAGFLGQTFQKTETLLNENLEGVLFIDEAYLLTPLDPQTGQYDPYGLESVGAMINFLSDHRSQIVLIVAGYEEQMRKEFFPSNPGLFRRVAYIITLKPYPPDVLFQIFLVFLRRINIEETVMSVSARKLLLSLLVRDAGLPLKDQIFRGQAGDIEVLVSYVGRYVTVRNLKTAGSLTICKMSNIIQEFVSSKELYLLQPDLKECVKS